jgi:hypothetical protein
MRGVVVGIWKSRGHFRFAGAEGIALEVKVVFPVFAGIHRAKVIGQGQCRLIIPDSPAFCYHCSRYSNEKNMKKGYVFPGQGSQFPGMGKDIYDAHSMAKELF